MACAKRVFADRGFHAANVSHICKAAGIGRGTLYLYFKNKRAVLEAILRETLARVRAAMERQARVALPAPERVTRQQAIDYTAKQLHELLALVFDDRDTLRILLREAVGLDLEFERVLGEIDDALVDILDRSLRDGCAAGFLRELDTRAVATMLVGGVEKLALAALRSNQPLDLARMAREAATLHAIGTFSNRLGPS